MIRALKQKAIQSHWLSHHERTIVRGILAPAGASGKKEVHEIIKHTRNYDGNVTERMLSSSPPKPMGCKRIREILGDFCDPLDCNCKFRPKKNDYAHPLRHVRRAKPATLPEPSEDRGKFRKETIVESKPEIADNVDITQKSPEKNHSNFGEINLKEDQPSSMLFSMIYQWIIFIGNKVVEIFMGCTGHQSFSIQIFNNKPSSILVDNGKAIELISLISRYRCLRNDLISVQNKIKKQTGNHNRIDVGFGVLEWQETDDDIRRLHIDL